MIAQTARSVRLALCLPAMLLCPATNAQTVADLDRLSRAAEQPATGLTLARSQISDGALLDALSTLERVILNTPANDEARLLHAGLLCRLDDREGSLVEFDALRGRNFPPALWSEATAPCSVRKAGK